MKLLLDLVPVPADGNPSDWYPIYEHFLPVPTSGCGHSLSYKTVWETPFCGLCFLKNGFQDEVPGRIHVSKVLADNGNPQQTGSFQGHVRVAEGIRTPSKGESMTHFRASRGTISSAKGFPFASSLWYVSGNQPPLAKPLILSVVGGHSDRVIARLMEVSLLNVVGRMEKAVDMATRFVRAFDG